MLAASMSGSNVAPDNLEPAPLPGLPTGAPHGLRKRPPGSCPQAYPAPATQQHAVGLESPGRPFAVRTQDYDRAIGTDTEREALRPALPQCAELRAHGCHPYRNARDTHGERRFEPRYHARTDEREDRGRPLHDAAQCGIRAELGGVCVR